MRAIVSFGALAILAILVQPSLTEDGDSETQYVSTITETATETSGITADLDASSGTNGRRAVKTASLRLGDDGPTLALSGRRTDVTAKLGENANLEILKDGRPIMDGRTADVNFEAGTVNVEGRRTKLTGNLNQKNIEILKTPLRGGVAADGSSTLKAKAGLTETGAEVDLVGKRNTVKANVGGENNLAINHVPRRGGTMGDGSNSKKLEVNNGQLNMVGRRTTLTVGGEGDEAFKITRIPREDRVGPRRRREAAAAAAAAARAEADAGVRVQVAAAEDAGTGNESSGRRSRRRRRRDRS